VETTRRRRLIDTRGSISQNVLNEAVRRFVHAWRWKDITSASVKIKPALFRATNSLSRKTSYVSRHFRRSYLKANKVSKSEETRKVECVFESVLTLFTQNYHNQSILDETTICQVLLVLRQCVCLGSLTLRIYIRCVHRWDLQTHDYLFAAESMGLSL